MIGKVLLAIAIIGLLLLSGCCCCCPYYPPDDYTADDYYSDIAKAFGIPEDNGGNTQGNG